MNNETLAQITALLGRSIGASADWSADAWRVDHNHFLVDDEGCGLSLIWRDAATDETWENPIFIAQADYSDWRKLVALVRPAIQSAGL